MRQLLLSDLININEEKRYLVYACAHEQIKTPIAMQKVCVRVRMEIQRGINRDAEEGRED